MQTDRSTIYIQHIERSRAFPLFVVVLVAFLALSQASSLRAADGVTSSDDDAMSHKLAGYIDCINGHTNWVLGSRKRYFSWLKSTDSGPTGTEDLVYGLYPLHDPKSCQAAAERVAAEPPSDPALEQAGAAYVSSLLAAEKVVKAANLYYSLEDYKDDGMQRGKALHPQLLQAYADFDAASLALYEVVIARQDAINARRLAQLEADPTKRADYLVELVMARAKDTVVRAEGISEKGFTPAPFANAVVELEQAWHALDTFRQANSEHADNAIRRASFSGAAFDLLKSAKAAERRQRKGFTFDDGERILIAASAAQLVEGHPAQLIASYNTFIGVANSERR